MFTYLYHSAVFHVVVRCFGLVLLLIVSCEYSTAAIAADVRANDPTGPSNLFTKSPPPWQYAIFDAGPLNGSRILGLSDHGMIATVKGEGSNTLTENHIIRRFKFWKTIDASSRLYYPSQVFPKYSETEKEYLGNKHPQPFRKYRMTADGLVYSAAQVPYELYGNDNFTEFSFFFPGYSSTDGFSEIIAYWPEDSTTATVKGYVDNVKFNSEGDKVVSSTGWLSHVASDRIFLGSLETGQVKETSIYSSSISTAPIIAEQGEYLRRTSPNGQYKIVVVPNSSTTRLHNGNDVVANLPAGLYTINDSGIGIYYADKASYSLYINSAGIGKRRVDLQHVRHLSNPNEGNELILIGNNHIGVQHRFNNGSLDPDYSINEYPLSEWVPKDALSQWNNITLMTINKDGLILGRGTKDGTERIILLLKVDLDIVHPATGELDEAREDANTGSGIVAIKRDDQTPVTQLKIHAVDSLPAGSKVSLLFVNGSGENTRYRIWKNADFTDEVISSTTQMDATIEHTLYIEGLSKSGIESGESVTQIYTAGTTDFGGDKVKFTVAQAEFDLVIRPFIPHKWTGGEAPIPMEYTFGIPTAFSNCVGGDRTFVDTRSYFDEAVLSRLKQRVVLTPYEELHSNADIENQRRHATSSLSKYYDRSEDVPPEDQNADFGESLIGEPNWEFPPAEPVPDYTDSNREKQGSKRVAALTLALSGGPGQPTFGAFVPNIDYEVQITIEAIPGVENKCKVVVEQNLYPAYEIVVEQSDGVDFYPIYQKYPSPETLPGPISLNSSTEIDSGYILIP